MRASESDRAIDCPHSLIQLGEKTVTDKAEDAREWGHLVHRWKETGRVTGLKSHVATFRNKLRDSGVDRHDWWPRKKGEHEVTFALHLENLTLIIYDRLEEELDRDEWKKTFGPEWLTGTIDWLVWGDENTVPWVDDLKTGHWPVDPKTSRQLLSYLLVPWVVMGCPVNWHGVVTITQWRKYPLHGSPHRSARRVTGHDLLEHLEELRWAVAHPEEATARDPEVDDRGTVTKMSPCAFCPNRLAAAGSALKSWKFNRLPTCWEGAITMLREGRLERIAGPPIPARSRKNSDEETVTNVRRVGRNGGSVHSQESRGVGAVRRTRHKGVQSVD